MGLLFDDMEEYDEYILANSQAIRRNPTNHIALNNRGLAHLEIGNWAEAEQDLRAACDIEHHEPIPELNLVSLLLKRDDPESSLHFANRAVAMSPDDYRCYVTRAEVFRRLQREADAESDESIASRLRKA